MTSPKPELDPPHIYRCPRCPLEFSKAQSYYGHLHLHKGSSSSPITCQVCQELFPTWAKLWKHQKAVHDENAATEEKIPCQYCADSFQRYYT